MLRALIVLLSFAVATPLWAEDVPKVLRPESALEVGDMLVIGEAEMIAMPELDANWRGRIDSGATTTSVHALKIEEFERDGAPWVRYVLRNDQLDREIAQERPVARIAQIQRRGSDETQRRPVVEMEIQIGPLRKMIEVNLTDRTNFEFPVLIGRNFLTGDTLIDVSRAYLHGSADQER